MVDVVVLDFVSNALTHSWIVRSYHLKHFKHKLMTFKGFHASEIEKRDVDTYVRIQSTENAELRMYFNVNLTQAINNIPINYDFCDVINIVPSWNFPGLFVSSRLPLNISLIVTLFSMAFHLVEDPIHKY